MGEQFCSVYTKEDTSDLPDLGPQPDTDCTTNQSTCKGVLKLLKDIKPYKASRPDNIPGRLLKEAAEELAPGLTFLFQISLDSRKIPTDWKSALVTPVFKNRSSPANYKPIHLTSIVCKILEHVVHSSVINHFERNNILTSVAQLDAPST